ncbi:DapH/DapD/GlmU-related protein [Paracoccus litorisediminis]|uniref:Antibiotic acetyltransferase n=1 Tax=Paracoccus litorisediminis TaxID=2006130 RepID=A0A844HX53_9RHOB|nr:DapH/DapD/GlmU-related protein [Paracoccus litorisediminis]MTH62042.1 antibiotic acetyltransferase [Paracoccus litorisediminis]
MIFSPSEVESFYDLSSQPSIASGNIRGPIRSWIIKGKVRCGKYTSINGVFNARGDVRIGSYCAFGQYVSLISGNHRTDMPNQQIWLNQRFGFKVPAESKGPVEIGHNVWIGDKVNVVSGVSVGHGAVIAAGATVTRDLPPFAIAAGCPARVIRLRFASDVIEQMLAVKWWDWDDERISRNQAFFELEIPPEQSVDLTSIVVP